MYRQGTSSITRNGTTHKAYWGECTFDTSRNSATIPRPTAVVGYAPSRSARRQPCHRSHRAPAANRSSDRSLTTDWYQLTAGAANGSHPGDGSRRRPWWASQYHTVPKSGYRWAWNVQTPTHRAGDRRNQGRLTATPAPTNPHVRRRAPA